MPDSIQTDPLGCRRWILLQKRDGSRMERTGLVPVHETAVSLILLSGYGRPQSVSLLRYTDLMMNRCE